jgi:8-oxo-dGTP pyrophosphatase MutT (NUDIX family)
MSKPAWLYAQSAVIPYITKGDSGIEVVLVTSKSSCRWGIPKGIIERNMTPQDSAAQEALEEAGVVGHVSPQAIAHYEYAKWGGICHVEVFMLKVTDVRARWQEIYERERMIVEVNRAIELVKPELKEVLRKFQQIHLQNYL